MGRARGGRGGQELAAAYIGFLQSRNLQVPCMTTQVPTSLLHPHAPHAPTHVLRQHLQQQLVGHRGGVLGGHLRTAQRGTARRTDMGSCTVRVLICNS